MTSVDTNIFVALWDPSDALNSLAQARLYEAFQSGGLVIAAPAYAELLAEPGRDERVIERFILETGITVDWRIDAEMWREAGRAYGRYATTRRKQRHPAPRRILTDFVIGAHASVRKYTLLTLDQKVYRAAFPSLKIVGL